MTSIITTDVEQARHQANIAAKAARLWGAGYTYKPFLTSETMFFVYPPQVEKDPYIVDVDAQTCTCPGFGDAGICSHVVAMVDEAEYLASIAAREDCEIPSVDAIA